MSATKSFVNCTQRKNGKSSQNSYGDCYSSIKYIAVFLFFFHIKLFQQSANMEGKEFSSPKQDILESTDSLTHPLDEKNSTTFSLKVLNLFLFSNFH